MNRMSEKHEKARDYLNKVNVQKQYIKSMERKLDYLENVSISSPDISGMSHNPNRKTSVVESSAMRIINLRDEIQNEMEVLAEIEDEIMRVINSVKEPKLISLLTLRYLYDMKWKNIAIEIDCGVDNIYVLHRKALDKIELPKEEIS